MNQVRAFQLSHWICKGRACCALLMEGGGEKKMH